MALIFVLIVELLLSSLINNYISYEILENLFLIINIFLVGYYLSNKLERKKTFYIIYLGYILRIVFMLIDLNITPLPFSGMDTGSYHYTGINIANALPEEMIDTPYGIYAKFVGIIYYMFGGPVKMFAQSINIKMFILSTVIIIDILKVCEVNEKWIDKAIIIYVILMPVAMFQSSILLRESIMIYFLTVSVFGFVKWIYIPKLEYVIISFIGLGMAIMLHSGVIVLGIVYSFVYTLYKHKIQKWQITFESIIYGLIIISVLISFMNKFGGELDYINNLTDIDSIIEKVNVYMSTFEHAGSAYLTNIEIVGGLGLIILTPLKLLYFLFSPMPWQLRGGMDLITFLLDSTLYIIAMYTFIRLKKYRGYIPRNIYNLIKLLYIMYIVMMIPYAWGTVAAGTAIRHRFKGFFILLICYTIFTDYIERGNKKNYE